MRMAAPTIPQTKPQKLNAPALAALAQGNSATAIARFNELDRRLAALPDSDPRTSLALRPRALILAIGDALDDHHAYFDTGAHS